MNAHLDRPIIGALRFFGTPPDEIVTDPCIAERFVEMVNDLLPDGDRRDAAAIVKRLLTLWRRGELDAGLPRLHTSYHGRK